MNNKIAGPKLYHLWFFVCLVFFVAFFGGGGGSGFVFSGCVILVVTISVQQANRGSCIYKWIVANVLVTIRNRHGGKERLSASCNLRMRCYLLSEEMLKPEAIWEERKV